MKLHTLSLATMAAVLVAGCNSSEDTDAPDDAAQPAAVLTPAPIATAAADGTALEPGQWVVTEDAYGAQAKYGISDTDSTLIVTCKSAVDALTFAIKSTSTQPEAWRLDAGNEAARIDMQTDGNPTLPLMVAQIDQNLAIINALGEPGQAFALTSPAGERRQFPTHPGIRRVIAACS